MKHGKHRPGTRGSSKKVGIARFRAEDWPRWLATADDAAEWNSTHAEWLQNAAAMAERLSRAGLEVIWIDLEPESFSEWCRARSISNNAEARSRFAAEQIGNLPAPPKVQ